MRIRIKFRKHGVMKFIGHLDVMRYFQKCIRRAGIDIAYSGGFSPHPLMSFAAPLSVGVTSGGEYLDMEVHSIKSSAQTVADLNAVMAEGMEILSCRRLKDTDKKAMAAVAAADYEIYLKEGYELPPADYEAALDAFFRKPKEIFITKQTKKSETSVDLKQLVYDFNVSFKEGRPVFYLKAAAGSSNHLKPELVLSAFWEFLGWEFAPLSVQIHRIDLYCEKDGTLHSLGGIGETIDEPHRDYQTEHQGA